jgi:hypothetical protein
MARCVTTGVQHVSLQQERSDKCQEIYNSAPLFGYPIYQCFGSGFNHVSGFVSGSMIAKMTHKNRKKLRCFEMLDVLF